MIASSCAKEGIAEARMIKSERVNDFMILVYYSMKVMVWESRVILHPPTSLVLFKHFGIFAGFLNVSQCFVLRLIQLGRDEGQCLTYFFISFIRIFKGFGHLRLLNRLLAVFPYTEC